MNNAVGEVRKVGGCGCSPENDYAGCPYGLSGLCHHQDWASIPRRLDEELELRILLHEIGPLADPNCSCVTPRGRMGWYNLGNRTRPLKQPPSTTGLLTILVDGGVGGVGGVGISSHAFEAVW